MRSLVIAALLALAPPARAQDATYAVRLLAPETALAAAQAALRKCRDSGWQAAVRNLPRAVMLGGGLLIEAQGSILGAIGVSGAPGGDADDTCARAGIDAIRDKIEF